LGSSSMSTIEILNLYLDFPYKVKVRCVHG
jgi:hypothetical protein